MCPHYLNKPQLECFLFLVINRFIRFIKQMRWTGSRLMVDSHTAAIHPSSGESTVYVTTMLCLGTTQIATKMESTQELFFRETHRKPESTWFSLRMMQQSNICINHIQTALHSKKFQKLKLCFEVSAIKKTRQTHGHSKSVNSPLVFSHLFSICYMHPKASLCTEPPGLS